MAIEDERAGRVQTGEGSHEFSKSRCARRRETLPVGVVHAAQNASGMSRGGACGMGSVKCAGTSPRASGTTLLEPEPTRRMRPSYGSLSEVETYDDLKAYQARKHEWKQSRAQRTTGVRHVTHLE